MKKNRTAQGTLPFLLATVVLCILSALPALAGDDVDQQLKAEYQNKVLTLRHFYGGDHLVYQFDGALIGVANIGPWAVYGQISVLDIRVRKHALHVRGRRVFLTFDSKAKSFRDVLNALEESGDPDREKEEEFYKTKEVEIEIGLPSDKPDLNEAATAMKAVFLAPGESMAAIVPGFWRDYFEQQEGRPLSVPHTAKPFQSLAPGGVTVPRATYTPEPEFSEWALKAKYQGTITVSLVVDASGSAREVQIVQPLGLGLDEKAVDSVSNWKFDPAKKDGTPMPVEVKVEVQFHLY